MSFRPAALGHDPGYALSDPGHEYLPGVTETWMGPLAARWGIEGRRASLTLREHLYRGIGLDGEILLPHASGRFRPVHGGNFHASKSLDAWLVMQDTHTRRKAMRAFAECAADVVKEAIIPELQARAGKGGAKRIPVEAMGTGWLHAVSSSGGFHLHYLFELHNVGVRSDGKLRAISSYSLFDRQSYYSLLFEAKLTLRLYQEFSLVLRYGPTGLEVQGLEALRSVKTPRQEEIDRELARKGLPSTPKTRHWAAQHTHHPRVPTATVAEAVRSRLEWLQAKVANVFHTLVPRPGETSYLREQKLAEAAVRDAVKEASNAGFHLTQCEFEGRARLAGRRHGADPNHLRLVLARVAADPNHWGLIRIGADVFTTRRIEDARGMWDRELGGLLKVRVKPPSRRAVDRAVIAYRDLPQSSVEETRASFGRRATISPAVSERLGVLAAAYQIDGRRVFVLAAKQNAPSLRRITSRPVEDPCVFAARLGKPSVLEALKSLRKHQWASMRHVEALYKKARQPKLELQRGDLLILDARGASHHAILEIVRAAKRAKAVVHVISSLPVVRDISHDRSPSRGPEL